MISVHPGQLKSVAVCSGDIVHLFAFWGSDIGPGYFLIPTRAPINSTIQVSGTISHPYFSVLPNTCFYRYPPAKRDNP
jgi:hypothetical protein